METIKLKGCVKDKLGWGRKDAFIAVWKVDIEESSSLVSDGGISDYVDSSGPNEIVYMGNYWGEQQMQIDGLDSRPLAHFVEIKEEILYKRNEDGEHILDDNGYKIPTGKTKPAYKVWTDKFTVDMEHLQSVQVLNSSMTGNAEKLRLVELDVKRRFPL
jgi:hypothetical protein